MIRRVLLSAVVISITGVTLAYGQDSQWLGVTRTNAELMAAARATPAPPSDRGIDVPLEVFGTRLDTLVSPDPSVSGPGLRVDLAFVGATGQGVPDTMGAAGPSQYLVVLNTIVRSFNKNTGVADGVLNLSLQAFFAGTGFTACCDPKVRFDRLSGRWFVGSFQSGRVLLAVSSGGVLTPQTIWTFFSFLQDQASPPGDTGCWVDYTRMSVDAHAVYFAFNMFTANFTNFCAGNFPTSTLFVIRKTSVLGAGPMLATAFRGGNFGTPADNFDSGATVGYIASFQLGGGGYYRVTDPGGAPQLSDRIFFTTPNGGSPLPPRHRGNALETGIPSDFTGRMFLANVDSHSVPVRNGRLWTARISGFDNTGSFSTGTTATRTGIQWIDVGNVAAAPTTLQTGVLFAPSAANDYDQRHYWVPALMVNGQGHMLLAGSAAGTNEYINAAVAGRLATDPPGTLRPATLYTNATETYTGAPDPSRSNTRRWGDYSNISMDPCDDMTMWAIQQFTMAGSVWGVAVARVKAPPPPSQWSIAPRVLPANVASINITITGTPSDGEGFYDPGVGFACRLSAASDGGVVVNSVTYTSPTSVTLNVSTVGATRGAHAVTITNPDGQPVTVAAALTIASTRGDFDGDGRADVTVFRPSNGTWYIRNSLTGLNVGLVWGGAGDVPVTGDYDGDGLSDMAVFRPSNGTWYLRSSINGSMLPPIVWGGVGDVPVPGDYDGDGKTDAAVFRPSNGTWYVRHSSTGALFGLVWGGAGDVASAGDYDGDGLADLAVFRPSNGTWYLRNSTTGALTSVVWGGPGDIAVPGDYDADGRTDTAVFRASTGIWYIRNSSTGLDEGLLWGGAGDVPVPGDYDADGKTDMAVFRPSNGTWYLRNSTTGTLTTVVWGGGSDIPVLRRQ